LLAYVFWHRPSNPAATGPYEDALLAFHRSLARSLPVGTKATASFRVAELPWLEPVLDAQEDPGGEHHSRGYEDWYLVEDFSALGVLNEAAVGRGHVSPHDDVAHRYGAGAGALYGLIEGEPCADALGAATTAVWVARPVGSKRRALDGLLGDGMDPAKASLWRRQLVFGPAPEFCLLAAELPSGVAPTRLPEGWSATILEREVLWNG
jgi:hypothetical protein